MAKKKISWLDLKGRLKKMPTAALMGLIQDLHGLNRENREFLEARFFPEQVLANLEEFRRRVSHPFYPRRGSGDLKFDDARKAIRDFEEATSDLAGTLDLMLTFVECGNRFTQEYGDIDERFYDAVIKMMLQFEKRLRGDDGRVHYPLFAARLQTLLERSDGVGWGYSDDMQDILTGVIEDFSKATPAPGDAGAEEAW